MSQSCVKTSSFHKITQITPHSFSRSPAQSHVLPALSIIYFWPLFLPFPLATPLLCPGPVHSKMQRFKAASSCCKCQQSSVPPPDRGAETTTSATVPSVTSYTVEKQMKYLYCLCRSTSCVFWMGFGLISAATALSLLIQTAGEKIHLYLHQYKTTANIQRVQVTFPKWNSVCHA